MENSIDISDLSPEDVVEVLQLIEEKRAQKNGGGGDSAQDTPFESLSHGAKKKLQTSTDEDDQEDELLRCMTAQRRALYEEIMKLRNEAGPGDFDIVEELRKIREGR